MVCTICDIYLSFYSINLYPYLVKVLWKLLIYRTALFRLNCFLYEFSKTPGVGVLPLTVLLSQRLGYSAGHVRSAGHSGIFSGNILSAFVMEIRSRSRKNKGTNRQSVRRK